MAMTNYYNRLEAKEKRRGLRSSETAAEALLWERLRDRQVAGLKFRRQYSVQYSVGVYVLDFYCSACRLAVEWDGESHASAESQQYDAERTEFLVTLNIQVVRFPNAAVHNDINIVLGRIVAASNL